MRANGVEIRSCFDEANLTLQSHMETSLLPISMIDFAPWTWLGRVSLAVCLLSRGTGYPSVCIHIIYIYNSCNTHLVGWWFQTFFIFHNLWVVILPIDELIFFRGLKTTNQTLPQLAAMVDHGHIWWRKAAPFTKNLGSRMRYWERFNGSTGIVNDNHTCLKGY